MKVWQVYWGTYQAPMYGAIISYTPTQRIETNDLFVTKEAADRFVAIKRKAIEELQAQGSTFIQEPVERELKE